MPVFEYKGLNKLGRNVKGTVDAENMRAARMRLKKDGVFVVDLKNKKTAKKASAKKVSNKSVNVQDLSMMTRQLATLLKANIPLVDALGAVSDQVENPTLSEAVADIKNSVNEGSQLHKAMRKYPNIFKNLYVSMCEAGEMSGTLDVILIRLAEFTEAQNELNSQIKGAMYYPVFMFAFTGLLLVIIFTYVIPQIVTVFESQPELVLPWYTVALIDLSHLISGYWHVGLATMVGSWFIFQNWKKTPSGKKTWDNIMIKFPVIGRLNRTVAVSRFTRTLSTLLTGGVPMLSAMGIVKNVVDNEILGEAINQARENISEGESIAGPLKKSGQFPPLVIHMISIGEKTGELENMLTQVSDSYDFQVKTEVEGLTALLSPVMIILMGGVIGVIAFAIFIPMFELANLGG